MFETIGAAALVGPGLGLWDLVLDSPVASTALAAVLFTMATTGIGLAVFGGRRQAPVETVAVVVQAPRIPRRVRRRR